MNLRDLEYFVAVAEEGHFGRAAWRCFVSQPTLSGQIAKLEEELGGSLFERMARSVRLTPLGAEVLPHARMAVASAKAVADIGKALADPLQGSLKIGVFPTMGPWWLPQLAPQFAAGLPKASFYFHEMRTPELLAGLGEGTLDAAFLADPDGSEFDGETLAFEPFRLLVPANHALARRKSVREKDLDGQEVLLLEDGHCLRDQVLDLCRRLGARESGQYRATGLETLRQTVRLGAGITLLPALAEGVDQEGLRTIRFQAPEPGRSISLRWRKTHPRAEALHRMAALVRAWAKEHKVLKARN